MIQHTVSILVLVSFFQCADAALCSNYDTSAVCGEQNDGGCNCEWKDGNCKTGTDCGGIGITSVNGGSCTLADGKTEVIDGWSGNDLGVNFCNACRCDAGALGCTKMACSEVNGSKSVNGSGCILSDKKSSVVSGWKGKDLGLNSCNSCFCTNAELTCTEMACTNPGLSVNGSKAVNGSGCILSDKKTAVVSGWGGSDVGPNSCNGCSCTNAELICTLRVCPNPGLSSAACGKSLPFVISLLAPLFMFITFL